MKIESHDKPSEERSTIDLATSHIMMLVCMVSEAPSCLVPVVTFLFSIRTENVRGGDCMHTAKEWLF
jgi:hypothetical protein